MGDYECPTCGKQFITRRGLGVHHNHVHRERLPNRTCANCARQFYSDYAKKYCSEGCLRKGVSFEGEANPNYQGKKRVTECKICGDEFEFYPSEKKGLYCPDCVKHESWRTPLNITGEENPRWKGGKLKVKCEMCGSTIERYPSNMTGEVTVCSEACRRAWLSEAFTGENHPNWKGGGNELYGKGWARVRREALERDGYRCIVCGTSKSELGRNPDVHHIIPVRVFITSENQTRADAHTLDNVVSLCVKCHRKADFGKISERTLREAIEIEGSA